MKGQSDVGLDNADAYGDMLAECYRKLQQERLIGEYAGGLEEVKLKLFLSLLDEVDSPSVKVPERPRSDGSHSAAR